MDNETLFNIVNGCVGVIGYFDCRPTKVEQDNGRTIVYWDHYGRERKLMFGPNGKMVLEETK